MSLHTALRTANAQVTTALPVILLYVRCRLTLANVNPYVITTLTVHICYVTELTLFVCQPRTTLKHASAKLPVHNITNAQTIAVPRFIDQFVTPDNVYVGTVARGIHTVPYISIVAEERSHIVPLI